MDLTGFFEPRFARKKKKRRGRGEASGRGGTSGRGHKGQRARSGGKKNSGFEGGQMPLSRRIPKWGFTNIFKKRYGLCNVSDLNAFSKGDTVDPSALAGRGIIRKQNEQVKVLGDGELKVALTVKAHKFSRSAVEKIEAAGGKTEILAG